MNTQYVLVVKGQPVYWTKDLDEMQRQIHQRKLQPGEYTIQEQGSWGAQ
jgi:hypothetical protein